MPKYDHPFTGPGDARRYICDLVCQLEDPEQILRLLHACDMAQAALVHCLFEENRYDHIQQTINTIKTHCTGESPIERDDVLNRYNRASAEFQLAREKLKKIIAELDVDCEQENCGTCGKVET